MTLCVLVVGGMVGSNHSMHHPANGKVTTNDHNSFYYVHQQLWHRRADQHVLLAALLPMMQLSGYYVV